MIHNIFENIDEVSDKERIEILLKNDSIQIERIVSYGFPSSEGFWYNQDQNEWVVLLSGAAEIEFKTGEITKLKAGDYLYIPAHQEHRVKHTSSKPNASWLCFYFNA